jgi:RNA polymerase sigma-70 factor (ECF subfamily)
MIDEDRELVLECQRGKMKAFESLVEKYKRPAFFIALGLVGNREDAYDLSQEAFVRIFQSIRRYNPAHRFFNWFYTILSNLCKNHLKKRRIQKSHLEESIGVARESHSPDVILEKSEINLRLWQEISKLSYEFREIIILKHFQAFSYREISEMLDIPMGSVMSRLYYARKKSEIQKHLSGCEKCMQEYKSFLKLKEVTDNMKFADLSDELWTGYWKGIYRRVERGAGWILLSIGAIILLAFGVSQFFRQFFTDPSISLIVKIGVSAFSLGVIILLVSIIRERLFLYKTDRYREVEK